MCDHGQRIGQKLAIIFWHLIIFYLFCITFDANFFYIIKTGPSEKALFVDYPKENHNERKFKSYILDKILDLPINTATEYVIRHFWYVCLGFLFILQIIKAPQGIKIILNRNFTIFTMCVTIFEQFMGPFHYFSNFIEEIDHFTLDLPKSFFLWTIQKKTTVNESLNIRL